MLNKRAQVGVDDSIPLLQHHFVNAPSLVMPALLMSTDGTQIGLDLPDAGSTFVERTDVPFVNGNTGFGLELLSSSIIASVAGGYLVPCAPECLADWRADASVPPVTNATRAMSYPLPAVVDTPSCCC